VGEFTLAAMSPREIGQLFINLNNRFDEAYLAEVIDTYQPGGIRYNHTAADQVRAHVRFARSGARSPLLVASNIEAGGKAPTPLRKP
jgi:beta-N-acetylhexosaminidase